MRILAAVHAMAPWIPAQGRDDGLRYRTARAHLPGETHHPSKLTFNTSIAGIPSAPSA